MDTKYAVMCVDISEGSGYVPNLIAIKDTYEGARSDAFSHMKEWAAKTCSKKTIEQCVKDGVLDFAGMHCWDESTCFGMQLSIQKITIMSEMSLSVV